MDLTSGRSQATTSLQGCFPEPRLSTFNTCDIILDIDGMSYRRQLVVIMFSDATAQTNSITGLETLRGKAWSRLRGGGTSDWVCGAASGGVGCEQPPLGEKWR